MCDDFFFSKREGSMNKNLKKMMTYYRPYRKIFWADMLFAILDAAVALSIPLIIRYITSKVVFMEPDQALHKIIMLGIAMVLMVAVGCYSKFFICNYGHVMGAKIEYDMRAEIFGHFQKLSFSFYDEEKVGQLMSRITSDLFDISELMHHGPENIVISMLKILGAFVILLNISPRLTVAAFLMIPFMIVYAYFVNRHMRKAFRQNRIKIAEINAQIEDNLSGIRVVKSFANEDIEQKKFRVGNEGFLNAKRNSYHYMGAFQAGLGSFTTLIQVCVIVAGTYFITQGSVDVNDLITFILYISVFTDPIRTLIDFTEQFQNGYSGFERFMEIMSIEPDIEDSEDAIEAPVLKGDICFKDVSFAYNDSTPEVLSHVSLNVPAGSYMALVGSSGAGKTTLCSLIPRFYEVTSGEITIDGIDIRKMTLKSLRNQIGIVQQDVYLFAGSVYENILYGKPDATEEEVYQAAKNANAHEFIMSLPEGYQTDIGQRGIKLSGGQKQRLSIARVFLKNPPILIFDEATSALDNESERVVTSGKESYNICHCAQTFNDSQCRKNTCTDRRRNCGAGNS